MNCSDCIYSEEKCFPILRAAIYLGYICKQGRRKNRVAEPGPQLIERVPAPDQKTLPETGVEP